MAHSTTPEKEKMMNFTREQELKLIGIGLNVLIEDFLDKPLPEEPKKTKKIKKINKRKPGSRKWTAKQRRDAAKRMQAFWKKKNGKK